MVSSAEWPSDTSKKSMVKMAEDRYTFAQARARLEDIVVQVRKKDISLEKSLDLLEEGVRLANACTELSDHTEWRSVAAEQESDVDAVESPHSQENGGAADEDVVSQQVVDRAAAELDLAESVEVYADGGDHEGPDAAQAAQDAGEGGAVAGDGADSGR
jgi:exodeoxyribonuclease VII small subunit